jgi:hypothetical protein
MPPLGTTELDPGAIQLLQEWITQELPGRLSFAQWQVQFFGSTGSPNATETADPDRDGHTNFEEFHFYTDPTVASSAPTRPQGSLTSGGTGVQFTFVQPANRAALVETSTDMKTWSLWDVAGNSADYPLVTRSRSLVAPLQADKRRFFRLRLSTP